MFPPAIGIMYSCLFMFPYHMLTQTSCYLLTPPTVLWYLLLLQPLFPEPLVFKPYISFNINQSDYCILLAFTCIPLILCPSGLLSDLLPSCLHLTLLSPVLSFTSEPTPSPPIPPIFLIPYLFKFPLLSSYLPCSDSVHPCLLFLSDPFLLSCDW